MSLLDGTAELAALPRVPRDDAGPVFAEPWQARAFALAMQLCAQGHCTWPEWGTALAVQHGSAQRAARDVVSDYYEDWLAALERLVTSKQLAESLELRERRRAWAEAYCRTPHGQPVELRADP